jgi:hypothetical protein
MTSSAPRQPVTATSHASGAVARKAPNVPTVAVIAASMPNSEGANHVAATLRAPTNVTAAPAPTARRPANSSGSDGASAIASVPEAITAPPIDATRRTPNASVRTPAGIMSPAYV